MGRAFADWVEYRVRYWGFQRVGGWLGGQTRRAGLSHVVGLGNLHENENPGRKERHVDEIGSDFRSDV